MARDQDPKTSRLYDRRTVERNIKKGLLTRKDYEKHLKALDDVAEKGVYGGNEDDDDEDDLAAAEETETPTEEPGTPSSEGAAGPTN
jgi:hypothetical protein